MDHSQDVLWDWSYRHPAPVAEAQQASQNLTSSSQGEHRFEQLQAAKKFLHVLHKKSLEKRADAMLHAYARGMALACKFCIDPNQLTDPVLVRLGILVTLSSKRAELLGYLASLRSN